MTGPERGPSPLSPGGGAGAGGLLAMALLSAAVALALVIGVRLERSAGDGRARLAGAATVVVRASRLESADAAAARAAELLGRRPEVARAWPQEAASTDPLMARLIDQRPDGAEPRLVAVAFRPGARANPAGLVRALAADGLTAAVDDHRPTSGPMGRTRILGALAVAGGLVLAALAVGVVTAAAVRRRAGFQRDAVDLLRVLGATDRFIGGLFLGAATRAALVAGITGAALAVLGLAVVRNSAAWPTRLGLAWTDLAVVLAWPPIAALAGVMAARLAVRGVLARAP